MKKIALYLVAIFLLLGMTMPGCNGGGNGNGGNGYTPTPSPSRPAEFVVSNLSTPPIEHIACSPLTVDVRVQNTGELTGTYAARLRINGEDIETQDITLSGGESKTVSFEITVEKQGSYTLSVGDASGVINVLPIPLSTAVIALDDLPDNFSALSQGDIDEMSSDFTHVFIDLSGDLSDLHGFYCAESEETFEFFIAFHIQPLSTADQIAFDLEASDPEEAALEIAEGIELGGVILRSYAVRPALSGIGDSSYGVRVNALIEGLDMTVDVVMIRTGDVLTMIYVYWLEGYNPVVTCRALALIISERVSIALATR